MKSNVESAIVRENARAIQAYTGTREYAHKQEMQRKQAQARVNAIYKEMEDYIANQSEADWEKHSAAYASGVRGEALDALNPRNIITDYRNRYYGATTEIAPSETEEWKKEQYLDILATGGTMLLKALEEINGNKSLAETSTKDGGGTYGVVVADVDYGYLDDIRSLKRRYGDRVDDWLKYVSLEANRNVQQELMTELEAFGKEHPGLAYPVSIGTNLLSGVGYIDVAGQKLGNMISGNDYPIDYNTSAQTFSKATQAMRQGATEDMSGLGSFLYNTTASIFDSAAAFATGKAGTALLGLSTATNAMHNAAERGLSDNQTLGIGFVAGALELITESKRFERVLGMKDADEAISGIEAILREGDVNGRQEFVTSLATMSYDFLTSGDRNELQYRIQQYMETGDTWDEANRKARKEQALGLLMDYGGGYISGSAFAAAAVAPSAIANTKAKIAEKMNGNAAGTINWNNFNGMLWPSPYGQLQPALADGWMEPQWQNNMPVPNTDRQVKDGFEYFKGNGQKGEGFREDKYYERQIDHWDELADGTRVKVGKVQDGSALNQVGLPASSMYFDVGKIRKAMEKHGDHLSKNILKGIPALLNDPVVIAEYKGPSGNTNNTVSVYGDLFVNGKPVVVGVVMHLDRSGQCAVSNIRTIHMRNDFHKNITDESVLYLNKDKRRTRSWFQVCGILNVPLEGTKYGLIRSITFDDGKVNGKNNEMSELDENTKNRLIMDGFAKSFD